MGAPKLLDKKLVNAELATQRKEQIDAGITLAKKVVAVRGSLEEEQKNLEEFRTFATVATRQEIDGLIRTKDSLISEVRQLTQEKIQLQIPLDKEWHEMQVEKQKLTEWEEKIQSQSFNLKQRREEVERREIEAERNHEKSDALLHASTQKYAEADVSLNKAHEASAEMRNSAQLALSIAELKEKEAMRHEEEVIQQKNALDDRSQKIEKWEQGLFIRELQLKEGWKTLQETKELYG